MGALARRAASSSSVALAADLARYGSSAQWRGIYYRGDKIGFSVGQTTPTDSGYEIREDGRMQMILLGSDIPVRLTQQGDRGPRLQPRSASRSPSTRGPARPRSRASSTDGASTSPSAPPPASAGRRGSSPSRPRSP